MGIVRAFHTGGVVTLNNTCNAILCTVLVISWKCHKGRSKLRPFHFSSTLLAVFTETAETSSCVDSCEGTDFVK